MMVEDLARASVSYFAVIDPIGNVVVFHVLTLSLSRNQRLLVAAGAMAAAFGLLALFTVAGQELLGFLGISTESFKVAAGLLLLPTAYRLVTEGSSLEAETRTEASPLELALVPFAIPMLAGPGALAVSISFSKSFGIGTTLLAAAIVLAFTFLAFAMAQGIFNLAGRPVLRLLSRLVGILLTAIAIDFVLEGSRAFFEGV